VAIRYQGPQWVRAFGRWGLFIEFELLDGGAKALQNRALWKGPRAQTGAGMWGVKSDEMATHLRLDQDAVADGFERLEARGRVTRGNGAMNDPAPWWFILPR
jgi:hypothetical protein